MATYVIGDIQGCLDALMALLNKVNFNLDKDRLWLVGDIINRGKKSLETFRYLYSIQDNLTMVLGNHDLHLLAVYYANAKVKKSDTLETILNAPDKEKLIQWLQQRPLMYFEDNYTLVHAGLAPHWTIEKAQILNQEITLQLQNNTIEFMQNLYGNEALWCEDLTGWARYRTIVNYCTRMRYCFNDGRLNFQDKGELGTQDPKTQPWFSLSNRQNTNTHILFGHWASLGFYQEKNITALDSGCVWGKKLTILCLEDLQISTVSCP